MFTTLTYEVDGRVCRITLDRPEHGNAIIEPMPAELRQAVEQADADPGVHVIVLSGAGKIFCGGYDLSRYAEADGDTPLTQSLPWDPIVDYRTSAMAYAAFSNMGAVTWVRSRGSSARRHGRRAFGRAISRPRQHA